MRPRLPAAGSNSGFTLVEMVVVIAVIGTLAAMAFPIFRNVTEGMRLNASARDVERELQTARLRAVSANRPLRVRFNCPSAGEFRMVELIGSVSAPAAADSAADRCSEARYPYPAPDHNALTRPNYDGPVRRLHEGTTFSAQQTIEFWPDGTAHVFTGANPWTVIPSAGATITVTRNDKTKSITVNGVGKVQLQ